ncbi:MAG TPA: response regulator transcription factor [Phycisphaerae bacterium]|nr:response regulator transcription factor [Phycisphaerae bacterium]
MAQQDALRILIADDHAVVRRGLIEILTEAFPGIECGEAGNAPEVMHALRDGRWDILMLDITMPGRSGVEILKDVRGTHPAMPVLVLSVHPEDQYAMRVLKAGAWGYLTKDAAPQELVQAVRRVMSGGKYVSDSLADRLVRGVRGGLDMPLHANLSDREDEIMRMIASGLTVSDIAEQLSLSVKTISTYRARVLVKMGMRTNADLTRYAIENQLVQ